LRNILKKIERFLPKVPQDILRLDSTIKYEKLYTGALHLHLPNGTLEARFENKLQDTAFREGFDILVEEIAKYKGIHFPSHSDYPDRESVKSKLS
jgi:ribosome-associated translation inhibitor RaiA